MRGKLGWATGTLVMVTWFAMAQTACAWPDSGKVFAEMYEANYVSTNAEIDRCTVCHVRTDKKVLSTNYSKAIRESLGRRRPADRDELRRALRDVESKPSAIEGQTFGDLISVGKLPTSEY